MARIDVDDSWSSLDELVALHTADAPDELHRRLLCFPDGGGNKADAFEPWCLLRQFHKDESEGAVVTALLLLTDRRWRNATGRLVRRIEESDLVPDDDLDLLAQTFLAAESQVYWRARCTSAPQREVDHARGRRSFMASSTASTYLLRRHATSCSTSPRAGLTARSAKQR